MSKCICQRCGTELPARKYILKTALGKPMVVYLCELCAAIIAHGGN